MSREDDGSTSTALHIDSISELKSLLNQQSDLAALERSLNILLGQLARAVNEGSDTAAAVVLKYFEASQTAPESFMKLWNALQRVNFMIKLIY